MHARPRNASPPESSATTSALTICQRLRCRGNGFTARIRKLMQQGIMPGLI